MDENLHNHIDKLFRVSIEPLSELPAKHVWDNIEQQLDKNNAEKYKRKYIIFKGISGVLLFLLLSVATFNLINNSTPINIKRIDNGITKKESSDYINSSINNNNLDLNHQNSDVNSQFLNDKNRRNQVIGERQTAKIKNGNSVEQDLSANGDMQFPHVNSTELVSVAIRDKNNDTTLFRLPTLQLLKTETNDSVTTDLYHLTVKTHKKNNKIFQRFFVTAFAAPELANYTLEDDETNHFENKQVIQKRETHLFSYSAGFLITYNLNKKFTLQSGVTYSSSNINIDPNKIYAVKDNSGNIKYRYNTSSGYGYILPSFNSSPAIGDSLYTRISIHTLQFISIPVVARYKFEFKGFSIDPGVGIVFNFLTKASLTTEVKDLANSENEVITKLNGLKKINYSFLFTSELQYQVSKKWSFMAAPYFKYALAPINNGSVVKTYPYNIGLGIGVVHKL